MQTKLLTRSWLIIALSLGIGLSAAASIVNLNHWARNSHARVLLLAEVYRNVKGQSAISWFAYKKGSSPQLASQHEIDIVGGV